jgi:hypothetical protein
MNLLDHHSTARAIPLEDSFILCRGTLYAYILYRLLGRRHRVQLYTSDPLALSYLEGLLT